MPKIGATRKPASPPEPTPVSLLRLSPGTRFSCRLARHPADGPGYPAETVTGTLLSVNECRAHVKLDGGITEVSIVNQDGEARTFKASKSKTSDWGPDVLVTPLSTPELRSDTMPSLPTVETTPAVANPVAEPKAAKAKAPKAAKKPAKPTAKKPEAKASANGAAKKNGLRAGQERIIKTLLKHEALPWAKLAAKAEVDPSSGTSLIGSDKDDIRLKNDKRKFPSLISLGLVKRYTTDEGGEAHITLTAKGKTAAAKI